LRSPPGVRCKYDVEVEPELQEAGISCPETATLGR
jgi:hypothetical protein